MSERFVHPVWSSRLAFVVATAGAAVGLGNLWRFPFLAGSQGGGAFVLIYLGCVAAICLPIIIAEIALGRMGRQSPIESLRLLAVREGASKAWIAIGWLSLAVPFMGFTYYSIVAGWSVKYAIFSGLGLFSNISGADSATVFANTAASYPANLIFQGLIILATAFVVGRGLKHGIEIATKVMMPALFLILLFMIGYNVLHGGLAEAAAFLFVPDWSKVTGTTVLYALGQSFFSVGVGVGFMITYGAYLPKTVSIPRSAAIIAGVDTLVSLLAGLAIFPIVFAAGLNPSEGPGLTFVTMPVAFGAMALGQALAVLFFVLLFLAAFTSTIAMLEPLVCTLIERAKLSRLALAFLIAVAVWAVGVLPSLSWSLLDGVKPLAFLPGLAEKSVFETFDFFTASILIPANAFLIAAFSGWIVMKSRFRDELALSRGAFSLWRAIMMFLAPLAVAAITMFGLVG
jgi:neurotransmitter:Na+ symporter, NSS family